MHYIQSFILDRLSHVKILRNKDMRPPHTESNLYQYHLKQLQREHYVAKVEGGYTLANKGLTYAASHSTTLRKERLQPQVLNVLFVVNKRDQLLIRVKQRQPFIGMGGLVIGKMHRNETVITAATRELTERVSESIDVSNFEYFGTAHVVIRQQGCIISDYIGLLTRVEVPNDISLKTRGVFYDIDKIDINSLSPGVKELIAAYIRREQFVEIAAEYS